uniref:Translationally-controlled tumor protein n=1 Tax=Panthera tigris altaica TaxID=74533 RepID=A0A8C9L0Y1_PANTA
MIIHQDFISHDEMFSDIYKIQEIADPLCLEVEGKMVRRTVNNIDDSLTGGSPKGEGTGSSVITGVDIAMNYHFFTKEAYKNIRLPEEVKTTSGAGILKNKNKKQTKNQKS